MNAPAKLSGMMQVPKRLLCGCAQESMYRCLIDIAAGMDYLHSLGVINGDLKPANVLLKSTNADARGFVCKVRGNPFPTPWPCNK